MRTLAAFGLALLSAGPAVLLWASRPELTAPADDESAVLEEIRRLEMRQFERLTRPFGHARLEGLSPFGDRFVWPLLREGNTRGFLVTPLGHLDPQRPEGLLGLLPDAVRHGARDIIPVGRGGLVDGLNYMRISREAIVAGWAPEAQRAVAEVSRVQGHLPEGWLLVYVEPQGIARLRRIRDLDAFQPMQPGFKIARDLGRRPLIERARAASPELLLEVFAASGADLAQFRADLAAIPGVSAVLDFGPNGYQVRADYRAVPAIARLRETLTVEENREMMDFNAKNGPTIQGGSVEDTLQIRPFDEAGVDGGGQDINNDGRRLNNGSDDPVPPQIVAVADNGISPDTANFSETATAVSTLSPFGPSHRKIHALYPASAGADRNSCDGLLQGAGTHGHIVASVIAAYPSQLGVFATRVPGGPGGSDQPRNANLDGVARGARILFQDIAATSRCTVNSLIERGGEVVPGSLALRLNEVICPKSGGAGYCAGITGGEDEAHIAVLPFGAPDNFSTTQFLGSNGTYPQQAVDIDTFLYNNRDFTVVAPVGNSGALLGTARIELAFDVIPDLFNGTAADENPNLPRPIQIASPSTAKNLIAVGASDSDCTTFFTTSDCENDVIGYSSRGPATPQSLRMAPLLVAPSNDIIPTFETASIAVFRSRDADDLPPVDNTIDEGNFGSSFGAANVTGAATIVRDYFAQGLYPTGTRSDANRMPNVSGALVKANLVAGAKFQTTVVTTGEDNNERAVRRGRGVHVGTVAGVHVGVMGNNEQGYGRPLLTQSLPLPNWSDTFEVSPNNTPEFPSAGLLVWDHLSTGQPVIGNDTGAAACDAGAVSCTQTFQVSSPNTVVATAGPGASVAACQPAGAKPCLAARRANLRLALAWTDPPSPAGSGGPLVNDLDLRVESPGADNCLRAGDTRFDGAPCAAGSESDNRFYDGNVYVQSVNNPNLGQWSLIRTTRAAEVHDCRNPVEAVHLSSDRNNNFTTAENVRFADSDLFVGNWRVTVERGGTARICKSGSTPGISCTVDADCAPGCIGGSEPGSLCAVDGDCAPGCVGGFEPGTSCAVDGDCEGGGRCVAAICGATCGRASPCPPMSGGSTPGSITGAPMVGAGPNEDADGDGRLKAGRCSGDGSLVCHNNGQCTGSGTCRFASGGSEDTDGDGLLDTGGQAYALVVAGPVFAVSPAGGGAGTGFPKSSISLDRFRYSCSDDVVARILDTAPGADPALAKSSTTFTVRAAPDGPILDTETNINFSAGALAGASSSAGVPVRLRFPAIAHNGILEVDTGQFVQATYDPGGQAAVSASAQVKCAPDFNPGFFATADGNAFARQVAITNGCDSDENLDAGETVTYGIGIDNRSRLDDYGDVTATLTPSGDGAAAIRVLDSPKNVGRVPANAFQGIFFHVFVDPAAANALPLASRRVTMTLTLDSTNKGQRIAQQSYTFTHAINADRETFHYSTDFPTGGFQVRDMNRNLVIDRPDTIDTFLAFTVPDEVITFSTLFVPGNAAGKITNTLGEDTDDDGVLDPGEDLNFNGVLDHVGILNVCIGGTNPGAECTGPADTTSCLGGGTCGNQVPWTFDHSDGGWVALRHPASLHAAIPVEPVWEHQTGGVCGFQTSSGPGKYGIWHTGDSDPSTPAPGGLQCENHIQDFSSATPPLIEMYLDVLHSPIVQKVNQLPDALGFPFTVEFQRWGWNQNVQTIDAYAGWGAAIDSNIDSDTPHCFLCQRMDTYYLRRFGTAPYAHFRSGAQYFRYGTGIDPASAAPFQRTFGPLKGDTSGTPYDEGTESGFTGFTQDSNPDSTSPIPTAIPDFLPYPLPGAPQPGVCLGGSQPGTDCQMDSDCAGGGTCALAATHNDVAGPVRNFDTTLIGFEGGFVSEILFGIGAVENLGFISGAAGNRWQLGIGFWAIESASHATDYGVGLDDPVFEWDEWHPKDETAAPPDGLGRTAACSRFNLPGSPGGGQCATLTVDRTSLYECDEAVEITVVDPKLDPPPATVQVQVVTDTDSIRFQTNRFSVLQPNTKVYTLARVDTLPAGSPPTYRGTVAFSGSSDGPNNVLTGAGDTQFVVYYVDPLCDSDGDQDVGERSFDDLDADAVPSDDPALPACAGGAVPPGCDDNCDFVYNPLQEDADGDRVGDPCDNCAGVANVNQADTDADGVGDACELDDIDGDRVDNATDNCPDVYNPTKCSNAPSIVCAASGDCPIGLFCSDGSGACSPEGLACGSPQCSDGSGACAPVGDPCGYYGTCEDSLCTPVPGPCAQPADAEDPARGAVCGAETGDLDGDGVFDIDDNCVLVSNPAPQADADGDGIGDACDGDCRGTGLFGHPTVALICSDASGACSFLGNPCGSGGTCQTAVVNNGACSAADDDADADGIRDDRDNCADIHNPATIAGTMQQRDSDRDGFGDACDPAGTADDDFDGVPDDLISFAGTIKCGALPPAKLVVVSAAYRDINGDCDAFPDNGETGRVVVTLQNLGGDLGGVTFVLTSSDPDVDCITNPFSSTGSIPAGGLFTLGTLPSGGCPPASAGSGFAFKAADHNADPELGLNTLNAAIPERIDLCVSAMGIEASGLVCFSLLADVDLPAGATPTFVRGPDGIAGSDDDGQLLEGFDSDRNADGNITVGDVFYSKTCVGGGSKHRSLCLGDSECVDPVTLVAGTCTGSHSGFYLRGSDTGVGTNVMGGVVCAGFLGIEAGNPACRLDPDFPMDWHLHCLPNATNCPNTESLPCAGGCFYQTPSTNDPSRHAGINSMHLGAHFVLSNGAFGDTTHFRMIAAFVSSPINLTPFENSAPPGNTNPNQELELSFFHIADLMDNNGVGGDPDVVDHCVDCGQVQVRLDTNPDPTVDSWGIWDTLAPFENIYDHEIAGPNVFSDYYCRWTPADAGTAPPAPRGFHETMCFPSDAYSSCGTVRGITVTNTLQCPGPGVFDLGGVGVWVESKFDLDGFLGQRIQIRWIGQSWVFDAGPNGSYFEASGFETQKDDGWWIDTVKVTGAIASQAALERDTSPDPSGLPACPDTSEDNCVESTAGSDNGTDPRIGTTDLHALPIDDVGNVAERGKALRITAVDSTLPGGCAGGVPQFRFFRRRLLPDGNADPASPVPALVQDWSGKIFFQDAPETDTLYTVQMRCSTDFSCTSSTGASATVRVYPGDGTDINLSLTGGGPGEAATLSWTARPQPSPMAGYDVFRATQPAGPPVGLGAFVCFAADVPQGTIGAPISSVTDPALPALHEAFLYLVGHSSPTAGALTAVGRVPYLPPGTGAVQIAPVACP